MHVPCHPQSREASLHNQKHPPFLKEKELGFIYWCWNPNGGDTGGLVKDDWKTEEAQKVRLRQPLLRRLLALRAHLLALRDQERRERRAASVGVRLWAGRAARPRRRGGGKEPRSR